MSSPVEKVIARQRAYAKWEAEHATTRERRVLLWIEYWLAWQDQTGIDDLSPAPIPRTPEPILALIEELITPKGSQTQMRT